MEEAIKALEETENKYFGTVEDITAKKPEIDDEDDIFNDEKNMKRFALLKASSQIKKTADKRVCLLYLI
jgi:hypothetical protein